MFVQELFAAFDTLKTDVAAEQRSAGLFIPSEIIPFVLSAQLRASESGVWYAKSCGKTIKHFTLLLIEEDVLEVGFHISNGDIEVDRFYRGDFDQLV